MSDSQSNISMPSGNYMVSNSAGKNAGSYIDVDFDPSSWKEVEAYTEELLNRKISCSKCLEGIIRAFSIAKLRFELEFDESSKLDSKPACSSVNLARNFW